MMFRGLLFLSWFFPLVVSGQSKMDSLQAEFVKSANDSVKAHLLMVMWENTAYSEPEKAGSYALQALDISKKAGYKRGMADAWQRIASGFTVRSMSDSAVFYYNMALAIYSGLKDVRMEGVILTNIATLSYQQGEYVHAMLKTEEGLKKSSEANDLTGIAVSLQLLGNIHHFLSNYDESLKYHIQAQKTLAEMGKGVRYADGLVYLASSYLALGKTQNALENLWESIAIYEKAGDRFYLAQALNNAGYLYYETGHLDSAAWYLSSAIELSELYGNREIYLLATNNMGLLHKNRKAYNESESFFIDALQIALQISDKQRIALISRNLGDLALEQKNFKSALSFFNAALKAGLETGSKNSLMLTYFSLSEFYSIKGDFKKALEFFRLYTAIKDSIFDESKTHKIEEMNARFEKEKQDSKISIQKGEIALLSKDIELQSFRQRILLGGLFLAVFITFYFVIHFKRKMARNRNLREQERLVDEIKLKNVELQRNKFRKELELKENELTSHALQIVRKNELLQNLQKQIIDFEQQDGIENKSGLKQLRYMIKGSAQTEKEWANFNRHFEKVHPGFFSKLKQNHSELTSHDLRLAAMLRLNLNSKEIAAVINITPESVKKARYRLRKKLGLPNEGDLYSFMMMVSE
jgi:tetratricopeptide (TPR) repeat protein